MNEAFRASPELQPWLGLIDQRNLHRMNEYRRVLKTAISRRNLFLS
jgi:hypothetical protein